MPLQLALYFEQFVEQVADALALLEKCIAKHTVYFATLFLRETDNLEHVAQILLRALFTEDVDSTLRRVEHVLVHIGNHKVAYLLQVVVNEVYTLLSSGAEPILNY